MTAHLVGGVTATAASALVISITSHIRIGASLGCVLAVSGTNVLTVDDAGEVAIWGVDEHLGRAWRLVQVSPELMESTHFADGEEVQRRVFSGRM